MSTTVPPLDNMASEPPEDGNSSCLMGMESWSSWRKQLTKKRRLQRLRAALGEERRSPLLWALPDSARGATRKLLERVHRASAAKAPNVNKLSLRLTQWLDTLGERPASAPLALECLAWARALPWLAQHLPLEPWSDLLQSLCRVAGDAANMPFERMPVTKELLSGELPLTLAALFPDLAACRELADVGERKITSGMHELLDGEGLPHAQWISDLRPLLACWTRCLRLAKRLPDVRLGEDVRAQYEWLVRQAMRMTRHDGRHLLGEGRESKWDEDLMRAAIELDVDSADLAAAAQLPWKDFRPTKRKAKPPEPAVYSEWSELAVLRSTWQPFSPLLAVAFHARQVRCELAAFGRTWLSGQWPVQVSVDGRPLEVIDDIQELCWFSDDDVDYLELEAQLSDNWRLQRQFLLARRDLFLYVGQSLIGPGEPQAISCRSQPPLTDAVRVVPASETREATLRAGKVSVAALPLSLPEWRSQRSGGQLEAVDGRWELAQSVQARALHMPLFINLNPQRPKQLTWRQLTVAENLQIQPPEVAVGYRVQFGEHQWMFYRSLANPTPRTLLGQHLGNEFVAARFLPDGELEELLEIEESE